MNAANITDSEIESYLLGAVEGKTAESIDELTFLDENFAARVDAVERDLIDGYLREELDADSVRRFESFYLQSTKRREKMQLGASFGEFIAAAAPNIQHPIRAEPAPATKEPWFGWRKFAIPAFAAAAILLAVAVPLWLNSGTTQQQANINAEADSNQLALVQPTAEPSPVIQATASSASNETPANQSVRLANDDRRADPPAPRVFALSLSPQLRGTRGEKRVSIPSDTDSVAVTLQLEPTDYPSVRIELKEIPSGGVIWQGRARPSGSGAYQSVKFRFPGKLIRKGSYSLVVIGQTNKDDSEVIGDYPFSVAR